MLARHQAQTTKMENEPMCIKKTEMEQRSRTTVAQTPMTASASIMIATHERKRAVMKSNPVEQARRQC